MISDVAHAALTAEVQQRGAREGTLAFALLVYQKNFDDMKSSDPSLGARDLERSLLIPTSLDSIMTTAQRSFRDAALYETKKDRARSGIKNVASTIAIGLITNLLFVVLMVAFYLAAQDTAKSFFSSLGIAPSIEQKQVDNPAEPIKLLPYPSQPVPNDVQPTGQAVPKVN